VPARGSLVHRGPVIVAGWALGADGPAAEVLLVVDGQRASGAEVGKPRPDVAGLHPRVPGAERAGWEASVDVRSVAGPTATLMLLARARGGDWIELDRSEIVVEAPGMSTTGRRAAFTIARDESRFLPIWLRYYGRHFDPADIYVLDHDSSDGSTEGLAGACNAVAVHCDRIFDQMWIKGTVQDFQAFLLRSYETVLYAEVDEFVVPDPSRHADLGSYIDEFEGAAATCTGYNVVHYPQEGEPPLRFDEPVLCQRRFWHRSPQYSKRLLSRVPLTWNVGFHQEFSVPDAPPDPGLLLVHLHRVDYDYCLARHRLAASGNWNEEDLQFNLTWHQRVIEPDEFHHWFFHGEDLEGQGREPIPERVRDAF
jgi:hypothetical protein